MSDEAGRRSERREGRLSILIGAKHADENLCAAQVATNGHCGHAKKSNSWVFDVATDDVGKLFSQELTDLQSPPAHDISVPRDGEKEGRRCPNNDGPRSTVLGACHLFAPVELDLIAGLEIVEPFQAEPALVAGGDLPDIVLETTQRLDGDLSQDGTVA